MPLSALPLGSRMIGNLQYHSIDNSKQAMSFKTPKKGTRRKAMQSVAKALSILMEFTADKQWLGVTELSRSLKLNKATVHHILNTLAEFGFIEQSLPQKKYGLGLGIIKLAGIKLKQLDVATIAMPIMKDLMIETGETVVLSVLYRSETLYLAKVESPQPVRVASYVGGRGPLHCDVSGKVLLAFSPEMIWQKNLPTKLKRFTDRTITKSAVLFEELRRIRKQGYALDIEEYSPDLCGISAPVWDATGHVVAAVAVVAPASRIEGGRLEGMISEVIDAADRISAKMGYLKSISSARDVSVTVE